MLILVISWLLLLFIFSSIGLTILNLLGAAAIDRVGDRFIVSVWLGIVLLAVALLATALATPLSALTGGIVAGILLLASLSFRSTRRELISAYSALSLPMIASFLFLMIGVAVFTTQSITWYDTGLYHYNAIKWLSEFGAVPGIALIHSRFGVTSSWFALLAPFNSGVLETRSTMLMDGLGFLLAVLHFLLCLTRCLTDRARLADWLVLSASALFIPIIVFSLMPISAAPDLATTILTVVTAGVILIIADAKARTVEGRDARISSGADIIPVILAAGAVTMKISSVPLLIVTCLYYLLGDGLKARRLLSLSITTLLILAPWVTYQVIASGCPLFPSNLACADLPWLIDAEIARGISRDVQMYARWNFEAAPPNANSWNWILPWVFFNITAKNSPLLIVCVLISIIGVLLLFSRWARVGRWVTAAGLIGVAAFLMFRATNLLIVCVLALALISYGRRFRGKSWLLAIGFCGTILILYSGPDLRYGLGPVSVLFGCFATAYRETLRPIFKQAGQRLGGGNAPYRILQALLIATALLISLSRVVLKTRLPPPSLKAGVRVDEGKPLHLLVPPALPTGSLVRKRLNDVDYWEPQSDFQCWASELPCTPYPLPADLALRDPARGAAGGFIHKAPAR